MFPPKYSKNLNLMFWVCVRSGWWSLLLKRKTTKLLEKSNANKYLTFFLDISKTEAVEKIFQPSVKAPGLSWSEQRTN